ncbi:MAG TPA: S8 family serine peptidase, partial [Solirubrobacteraceae bacterium]
MAAAVRSLRRNPEVAYAEPDYLMHASARPNDPSLSLQWAANNTGQSVPSQNAEEVLGAPSPGTAGADEKTLQAWGVTTGNRSIVIGETDTGIDYTHPDLAANVWTNPGGIGGCASGTHGYNEVSANCNPLDNDTFYGGHGTHVAGIMGAVANNGVGVAGVNWQTTILPVKWLNESATGTTSALIAAMQWLVSAKQAGVNVRVVNDSATFVGTARSQALSEEIDTLGANSILFVTAAGNTGENNDSVARYPCDYDRPTEICVTASNDNDQLPTWANTGSKTVDLAAPGVSVYSTLREGKYGYLSGGSMASPQVAGAAALILSVQPSLSPTALKADILEHVDKLSSLSGRVITGGRLDVCKAVPGCSLTLPPSPPTFGKTSVGASSESFAADRKRVNRYALPSAGSVTKLSVYLSPTSTAGQQVLKGIVYADSNGAPGALLGVSEQLTFTSTSSTGWYDLNFTSPLKLAAGNYWIGVITGATANVAGYRFDTVASSRDINANTYTAGPSNPFGAVSVESQQTSLYATYTTGPTNTSPPTITGTAQQGQTLTEQHGSWTNEPTGYAYQWQRCDTTGANCVAIGAATAQTYLVASADVGHTLRVQETASNAGGAGAPASSAATSTVIPLPPSSTSPPTITGTTQQGQTLTEQHGSWTNEPTGYAYQWQRCDTTGANCVAISSATGQTYVLLAADVGHTIKVQESASNSGGSAGPATSAATTLVLVAVLVPPAPSNTSPPTITGTAQQGQTLTEQHGAWTNEPTGYAYQWQRCDNTGANCSPIA